MFQTEIYIAKVQLTRYITAIKQKQPQNNRLR